MWYRGAAPAVIAFGDSLRSTPFIVFGRRATSPAACGCVVIAFDGAAGWRARSKSPTRFSMALMQYDRGSASPRLALGALQALRSEESALMWSTNDGTQPARSRGARTSPTNQLRAHLTLRSIVHTIERGRVVDGTEIWIHVELTSAERRDRLARVVPLLLHRGLDLLASELDAR